MAKHKRKKKAPSAAQVRRINEEIENCVVRHEGNDEALDRCVRRVQKKYGLDEVSHITEKTWRG